MERKRRERINTSLNDLARLLTEARMVKAEAAKANKLEKADILELTVQHLKNLKETGPGEEDSTKVSSYADGFSRCMGLVEKTLVKAGKEGLRERILTHLKSVFETIQPVKVDKENEDLSTASPTAKEATVMKKEDPTTDKPQTVQSSLPTMTIKAEGSATENPVVEVGGASLTLVPTRLPTGRVGFLIRRTRF